MILIDLNDLKSKWSSWFLWIIFIGVSRYKSTLIGTYSGKIILITVNENSISIDDSYLICQEVKVKSISCNKNDETDLEKTFVFIANCGYYKIFQIKNLKILNAEEEKNENSGFIIIIVIIVVGFICWCFAKRERKS